MLNSFFTLYSMGWICYKAIWIFTKRKLIAVQGSIHTSTYEKEGEKRNSFSIQWDKIILHDSKNKE